MNNWRWPTDADWAAKPPNDAWGQSNRFRLADSANNKIGCAAEFFDPTHDHCDYGNNAVQSADNSHNETWFVHDVSSGAPSARRAGAVWIYQRNPAVGRSNNANTGSVDSEVNTTGVAR